MSKIIRLKAKEGALPGYRGFILWMAQTHPKLYNMVKATEPNAVQQIENSQWPGHVLSGDDDATPPQSMLDRLVATITAAGGALLPLIQQQKILKIQLARAKAGQPPLDVGAYVDPNQGVNFGINPGTQKTLLYLGASLALAFVVPKLLGRRRA